MAIEATVSDETVNGDDGHILVLRYGHASAVAGNVAFLFGGASSINQEVV